MRLTKDYFINNEDFNCSTYYAKHKSINLIIYFYNFGVEFNYINLGVYNDVERFEKLLKGKMLNK